MVCPLSKGLILAQNERWRRGLGMQVVRAVKQLENSNFIYRLSQLLHDLAFDPKQLLLSIKDTATPISFDVIEKSINMLRYQGIKFLINDFGSGAFSFNQFKNFPVAYLKLDRALTDDIGNQDKILIALVKSAMSLARIYPYTLLRKV